MKKQIFLFLIFLNSTITYSQDSTYDHRDFMCDNIIYGNRLFKYDFYSQFNTTSNYSFKKPIQILGYRFVTNQEIAKNIFMLENFGYSLFIPQQIMINDSIIGKINGSLFSFNVFGLNLFSSWKPFHLGISSGLNFGRLRISGDEMIRQKNAFIAPNLAIQPQICIGNFIFTVRGEYEFDLSNKNWKDTRNTSSNKIALTAFNQTSTTISVGIGWMFKLIDGEKRESLYK